jgi:hypothetical protein
MLTETQRDEFYTHCALAVNQAGRSRESLFLARLALLLADELGDINRAKLAVDAALKDLPEPSLAP